MKEITRRLYTKPVMLTMAFLVGMALVVALSFTAKSTAALNSFPVEAGNDEFVTDGDGDTYHDFGGSPIKENFFGPGSLPFAGLVVLKGVPLSAGSPVDTVIERAQPVPSPGGSTPITMTGLHLKSTSAINVAYNNNTTETWDVEVGLSVFKSSTGTMTINSSTFDSTLKVWPKFTFTRVSDGEQRFLDTGDPSLATTQSGVADMGAGSVETNAVAVPEPCKAVISDFESSDFTVNAAATGCAPVTLTSTNSPWGPCPPGKFCITVPITEEERWAKHKPKPKPTPIIIKRAEIGIAQ